LYGVINDIEFNFQVEGSRDMLFLEKARAYADFYRIPTLFSSNPIYLAITSRAKRGVCLEEIEGYDSAEIIMVDALESNEARLAMNKSQDSGMAFVFLDYPIETVEDVDTVNRFIANSLGKRSYYTPRPNLHLLVQSPQLVAISDHVKNMGSISTVIYKIANWFKKSPISGRERSEATPSSETPSSQGDKAMSHATPTALLNIGGDWDYYDPGQQIVNRDLTERTADFFPSPKGIHVVLLNQCNLKCVMCPYHSPKYKSGHTSDYLSSRKAMTDDVMNKIIDYAAKNQVVLQFGQIEEPFMHKKLVPYLERCKDAGVPHIHLTTNGTILTKERADKLANSGVNSVMFSIDATEADSYREVRGGDLEDLEKKIFYFLEVSKAANITVTVSFILDQVPDFEREKFLEKWEKAGVDQVTYYVLTEHEVNTGKSIRSGDFYDREQRYPCATPWVQTVVYPAGEVSICCKSMTEVGWTGITELGNLKNQSFEEIWDGGAYRRLRQAQLKNDFSEFSVCSDCDIWSSTSPKIEESPSYTLSYNETVKTYRFKK
tara:strand:- start:4492 stop:6132 length:1641 start_codon:yes stop_codon:yes gene_type:complete